MINVSNTFKEKLQDGEQVIEIVDITFADGTKKTLENEIMIGNNEFSDCAESSSFPVGATVCKTMKLELDNTEDQWKDYNFYQAKVHAYLKLQTSVAEPASESIWMDDFYEPILDTDGNSIVLSRDASEDRYETIDKGVYTITTPEQYGEILSFTALDDMYKTNAKYYSALTLPQPIMALVRDACESLNIPMGFSSMAHGNVIVTALPDNMTFRQLIGWAAMLETANARIDNRGYLQFAKWNFGAVENGSLVPIKLEDYVNSPTLSSDDIVITGIRVKNKESESLFGTAGYVLELENNLLSDSDLGTVAAWIGGNMIGARFRNLQGDLIYNPLLEFGDMAYSFDRNGNKYLTPITDVSSPLNGITTVKTQADDPIRNSSAYMSAATKALVEARQLVKDERTEREKAVERLNNTLKTSGGLYMTVEPQDDGSNIYYAHNKPTLEESDIVWKFAAEAIGISMDGGKTYPYGFFLTGDLIAKILYAHGINADYIDTGALTVRDSDGNIIFQVDMDTKKVIISGDNVVIGGSSLADKLTKMDNNIASAKNMTLTLSNEYQGITSDADGNIPTFPTVATTASVMYGSQDVTNDCSYTITKSDSVTGSWDVNTHTYTVTGLIADNGWVDIKATYLQTLSITRRFTIAKLKAGKNGVNGLDGLQGEKGEQGVPGKDGKDGTNGVDGKTSYFHIKYSSVANPTSSSQMTETPSTYIGTYVDYEPNDSTDPKKYTWSKFEGSDGKDGIAGTNGTDGKTYYLHIAYANSADGKTGFSVSDGTNKLYIGQYTDTTKTDSTDPTKYTWSKIKGETGADGKPGRTYIIEPSCNVLKRGSDKVISPNFITFKAYYRDGDSAARVPYKGRFIVEETVDGSAWKTIYISSTDEDTVTHYLYSILTNSSGQAVASSNGSTIGIPRDVTNVRCKLYASGGTTTLMDMQSVAVVIDVDNLTQEQIVSILTNDGAWKGLYYSNGRLYVSLDALLGGTVTLGGKKNGNGYLKIKDASNAVKGLIDRSGYTVFTSYEENSKYMKYTGVQFSSDGIFPVDIKKFFDDKVDIEIENSENWGISWKDNSLNVYATEVSADTGTFGDLTVTNSASFAKSPKIENMEYTTSSNTICWDGRTGYKQLMLKSSSSKRYKDIGNNISEQEIEEWYNIEPTWAKYKKGYLVKGDENEGRYIPMFIAENVEAFFPEATRHQNGLVEDWNERIMIPAMFAMIKSQKSEIDLLKQELNEIKQLLRKE